MAGRYMASDFIALEDEPRRGKFMRTQQGPGIGPSLVRDSDIDVVLVQLEEALGHLRQRRRSARAGSAVCFNRPMSTTWLVISCSTISLCLASTASCALYPTATLVWPAIARLSRSVSETWLSPVRSRS